MLTRRSDPYLCLNRRSHSLKEPKIDHRQPSFPLRLHRGHQPHQKVQTRPKRIHRDATPSSNLAKQLILYLLGDHQIIGESSRVDRWPSTPSTCSYALSCVLRRSPCFRACWRIDLRGIALLRSWTFLRCWGRLYLTPRGWWWVRSRCGCWLSSDTNTWRRRGKHVVGLLVLVN